MQDIIKAIHATMFAILTSDLDLECEAAWRLQPHVADALEREADTDVDVRELTHLASGTSLLKATKHSFERLAEPSDLPEPEELQQQLFDAFRTHLVPPSLSASTFIMLSIHPAWGLRIAYDRAKAAEHEVRDSASKAQRGLEDESVFPEDVAAEIDDTLDSFVSEVLQVFAAVGRGSVNDIAGGIRTIADEHYQRLADSEFDVEIPIVSSFRDLGSYNVRLYLNEMIETWLEPCGVVAKSGDNGFEIITPELLK